MLVALEWRGGGGGLAADLLALPSRRISGTARRRGSTRSSNCAASSPLREEPAANLPIGRARMVELARAVVDRPRILLLDEPTSGLEESEVENLAIVIRRLCRRRAVPSSWSSTTWGSSCANADRVIVLNLGAVIANGAPDVVRADEAVRAAYLG